MFGLNSTLKLLIMLAGISLVGMVLAFLFLRPQNQPAENKITSQSVVEEIQKVGKLELIHYKVRDVFDKELSKPITLGFTGITYKNTSRLVLVISGEVIGCVDLTKINAESVSVSDSVVTVTLPEAEICVVKIDHQNTKVFSSDFSLLTTLQGTQVQLVDEAYKEAEKQLLVSAQKEGIIKQTNDQAKLFLKPFFAQMGIKNVVFESSAGNEKK